MKKAENVNASSILDCQKKRLTARETAKVLGVSYSTIRKRSKSLGLPFPRSPKRSPIDLAPIEKLEELVKQGLSLGEVALLLGVRDKAWSRSKLASRLNRERPGMEYIKTSKYQVWGKKDISHHLKRNGRIRDNTKKRLFEEGILRKFCYICGQPPKWRGEVLTLQIDHINGNPLDHSIDNLRVLCPNCHSQTKTYAGKGSGRVKFCKECGDRIFKYSVRCRKCDVEFRKRIGAKRKVKDRPPLEELTKTVEAEGYESTGRKFGVTGNAVKKWILQCGVPRESLPHRRRRSK